MKRRCTAMVVVCIVTLGLAPQATAGAVSPVRESLVEGVHRGPWRMTTCTWTNCEDLSRRSRLHWGFSPVARGVLLRSYSGGYRIALRWIAADGEYRGEKNIGRRYRRRVELHVTERSMVDGVWTATKLAGTTKVWSRGAPRYHDTGRFVLSRKYGWGRLVFQASQTLVVIDGDGTDPSPIGGICEGFEPSWRAAPSEIAFIHRCGPTGTFEVSAIGPGGGGLREMLATLTDESGPDWSGDGRLALTSDESGDRDVYVMDADGGGLTDLTDDPALDAYPAFSPDGSRIAFTSDRDGDFDLYVMDSDGSGVEQLTFNPADDGAGGGGWGGGPSWSPDGRLIAFESDRSGNMDIYTLNVRTGAVTRVTRHGGTDVTPAFSPDGTRIAFSSDRAGGFDIYTVGPRGGAPVLVWGKAGNDYQPDWDPESA